MMQPLARMFSLLLLIVLGFSFSYAQQENEPPLMISLTVPDAGIVHTDLYRYTANQWEPVTSGGYKGGFSLSPDGGLVTYLTVPDFLREADAQGEEDVSFLLGTVWNITLLDLATGEEREIVGQPSDVGLVPDNLNISVVIRNGITREPPVWSPDGNALTWTEQDYPEQSGVARLVMVDMTNGETRVLDDALPPMTMSSDGLPPFFSWGESGIAVFTNDPNDNAETFRLYDPVTGTIQIIRSPDDEDPWLPSSDLLWVKDGDDEVMSVEQDGLNWLRIDPDSATITGLSNRLEFVSAANPTTSLRLLWDIYAPPGTAEWQLLTPDGELLESWADESGLPRLVIAPSGQAAAFRQDDGVYLWQNGTATQLTMPKGLIANDLFWGRMMVQFGAEYDGIG